MGKVRKIRKGWKLLHHLGSFWDAFSSGGKCSISSSVPRMEKKKKKLVAGGTSCTGRKRTMHDQLLYQLCASSHTHTHTTLKCVKGDPPKKKKASTFQCSRNTKGSSERTREWSSFSLPLFQILINTEKQGQILWNTTQNSSGIDVFWRKGCKIILLSNGMRGSTRAAVTTLLLPPPLVLRRSRCRRSSSRAPLLRPFPSVSWWLLQLLFSSLSANSVNAKEIGYCITHALAAAQCTHSNIWRRD